jgi:hypothetical protein
MKLSAAELSAADQLVGYLCSQVDTLGSSGNPLRDRYVGFCAVTIATHLETVVKNVILNFCQQQNKYLHAVFDAELQRFNGRISYADLRNLLKRFDKGCDTHFVALVKRLNTMRLGSGAVTVDVFSSYESVLQIRHSFVHNLDVTFSHVSSAELKEHSESGKRIVSAFARSLRA